MAKQQRIALVIGNGRYSTSRPLENPVNDAALITRRFLDLGFEIYGGASTEEHQTGLTSGMDLTSVQMVALIGQFMSHVTPGALAVIYYAGHGLQVGGKNYFVPTDDTLDKTLPDLGLVEIKPRLETLAARVGAQGTCVIFLDACRDDPMTNDQRMQLLRLMGPAQKAEYGQEDTLTSATRGGLSTFKISRQESTGRTFIGFATAPGDYAYDGAKGTTNSPFARALGEQLKIRGLDIEALFDRVALDVRDIVEIECKRVQDPWSETNLSNPVWLNPRDTIPISILGLLGGLAGLLICLGIFDHKGLAEPAQYVWMWGLGLLFGLVVAAGTMIWGSKRWFDAFLGLVGPAIGFALAFSILKLIPETTQWNINTRFGASHADAGRVYLTVTLLGGALYLVGITRLWMTTPPPFPRTPLQWLNRILTWSLPFIVVAGLLLLQNYIDRTKPLTTAFALFTVLGGVIYAMSVSLACRAQRGLFAQFGPITGGISVGLLMAVLFAIYASVTDGWKISQADSLPLLVAFGAFWHLLLGAQLGYCFAYYIPDHVRIRDQMKAAQAK